MEATCLILTLIVSNGGPAANKLAGHGLANCRLKYHGVAHQMRVDSRQAPACFQTIAYGRARPESPPTCRGVACPVLVDLTRSVDTPLTRHAHGAQQPEQAG
jgi:hypothetical protein